MFVLNKFFLASIAFVTRQEPTLDETAQCNKIECLSLVSFLASITFVSRQFRAMLECLLE